jgi:hypothetical protein
MTIVAQPVVDGDRKMLFRFKGCALNLQVQADHQTS